MRTLNCFESENLIIKKAEKTEGQRLQDICDSWDDEIVYEGRAAENSYISKCLEKGDLPPVQWAKKENFYLLSVTDKKTGEIVGVINLYAGYPDEKALYIGLCIIDKMYRKKRYGSEAINALTEVAKEMRFENMRLGVYLKNWQGIRFWHCSGFNTITKICGDKVYSTDTFALMELMKKL